MSNNFKAECCFKIARYGSIIHDKIDVETWKLDKCGKFVDTSRCYREKDVTYTPKKYEASLQDHAATCEAFMMRDKDIFLVVEVVDKWYLLYTYDGDCISYPDLESRDNERGISYTEMFDIDNVYYVGIELVDAYNIRYSPWTYRICLKDGYLYTSKGIFKLPISVDELTGWRPEMKKYAEIRYQDKYFGYLFTKKGYLMLYLNSDGTLGWEEVS